MTTLPQTTSVPLPRPVGTGPISTPASAPPASTLVSAQMTSGDVWRVLRSNLWVILGSLVASVIIGFALNWYLNKFHARYTAAGFVEIRPGTPVDFLNVLNLTPGYDPNNTLVVEQRTQARLLMHEALWTRALVNTNYEIRNTTWFRQFQRSDGTFDIADAKDDLKKYFSASPIQDSKLIAVSMTYNVPRDCKVIVEDIVNQHLEEQRKRNSDKFAGQIQLLNNHRIRYENLIKQLKQDTGVKGAQLQLDGMGRPGALGQKEAELQQLVAARIKAQNDVTEARASYESAQETIRQGGTPATVEAMVNQNPIVMKWKNTLDEYDFTLDSLENQRPSGRIYTETLAKREAAQRKLDEVRSEERANATVQHMEFMSSRVQQAEQSLKQITDQMDKLRDNLADMTMMLSDYLTKKDEELSYTELLKRVRNQLDTLQNQLNSLDLNTVSWSTQPETPDLPSFPRLSVTLAVCIVLGLALSVGISFLRELMDTSVRSPRDIARVGQMNLLGMIPHEDDDPQAIGVPLSTVIYAAPTSIMAEQFRQVRTRLQHAASLDTTRSILVTSPGPGDGKSLVACNLAAGLALNGRRILLVDANFRRPELHRLFALSNEAGLSTALNSIDNFESAVRQTKVPNFDVMPAGPRPANATELLESQLLIDFIERALEEYDHVIFDSGPMLVVSETVALAPRVDGVVTVVRARTNSRGVLQRMRDALRQLRAEHLGVVLNAVRAQAGGYYNRNIRAYYQYQDGNERAA